MHKILSDFQIQDHLFPVRKPDLVLTNKKKSTWMDFAFLADNRMKIKESKKIDKYLDFTREQKKMWNMTVMEILNIVGVLGMVPKGLVKRHE